MTSDPAPLHTRRSLRSRPPPSGRVADARSRSALRGLALGLALVALACGGPEDGASTSAGGGPGAKADAVGATVRVAVASNFATPLQRLARAFEARTGYPVSASAASTGKHYAQIRAGAPFDVFLAADADRPERLVEEGLAPAESLRRYASGRLVFVAHGGAAAGPGAPPRPGEAPAPGTPGAPKDEADALPDCLRRILEGDARVGRGIRKVAIANPETAPYGRAARETLTRLGLWATLEPQIVRGENVSQAFQFVESGNAAAGLVAHSQLLAYAGNRLSDCRWPVPAELHAPIEQKMVVLGAAAERPAVAAFVRFMQSEAAASIVRDSGYAP